MALGFLQVLLCYQCGLQSKIRQFVVTTHHPIVHRLNTSRSVNHNHYSTPTSAPGLQSVQRRAR